MRIDVVEGPRVAVVPSLTRSDVVEVRLPAPISRVAVVVPGPTGPAGDEFTRMAAAAAVSALRAVSVVANGISHTDGGSTESLALMVGISTNAASVGADVVIRRFGVAQDASWNWVPGLPLFVGVAGELTQSPPIYSSVRQVGVAITGQSVHVQLSELIVA